MNDDKNRLTFRDGFEFARGVWLFTIGLVILPAVIFIFVFHLLGFI